MPSVLDWLCLGGTRERMHSEQAYVVLFQGLTKRSPHNRLPNVGCVMCVFFKHLRLREGHQIGFMFDGLDCGSLKLPIAASWGT